MPRINHIQVYLLGNSVSLWLSRICLLKLILNKCGSNGAFDDSHGGLDGGPSILLWGEHLQVLQLILKLEFFFWIKYLAVM